MFLNVQDFHKRIDGFQIHSFDSSLREPLSYLLGYARASGADFGEWFFENRRYISFRVENQKLSSVEPALQKGAGIRLIKGHFDSYVTTNDLSFKGLFGALKRALGILGLQADLSLSRFVSEVQFEPMRDYGRTYETPGIKEIAHILLDVNTLEHKKIRHIQSSNVNAFMDHQEILVASTEGIFARDVRLTQSLSVQALCTENQNRSSLARRLGRTNDESFFLNIPSENMIESLSQSTQTMLHAEFIEAGQYPVVLANDFGGVIFHEACGHLLETTAIQRKSSPFVEMKDKKIAHEAVTAWDEGLSQSMFGSLSMDDEGMPTQKTLLIENGILRNFISDRMGEKLTGHPRTGSGRRQNYMYAPASRMRNTYIASNQNHSKEDLISSIDKGIYCKELGGGSVGSTGDFNFAVEEAYEIVNGQLGKPLKGATLIGDAPTIMQKISMVGNDLGLAAGFCGSVSGNVYVTVGQPHIKVDSMTIGGRS